MNKFTKMSCLVALAITLCGGPSMRRAQAQFFPQQGTGTGAAENIEGLTVAGKGSVNARPNVMEIEVDVAASSELTADAIVKYRDARKKLQEAFAALKLPSVKVDERGLLVNKKGFQNRYSFMFGEPNQRNKTEVELSRKLVIKATDIRKMEEEALLQLTAKLLDVAQDAGARVGATFDPYEYYYYGMPRRQEGLVRFVLDDFDKLLEEAYEKAMADARARAQRLARLGDVELGRVIAVREVFVPGDAPGPSTEEDQQQQRKQLVASKFQEIPIRVELLVRFEVHPKTSDRERAGGR
jgi:uncharacterized protein YggE